MGCDVKTSDCKFLLWLLCCGRDVQIHIDLSCASFLVSVFSLLVQHHNHAVNNLFKATVYNGCTWLNPVLKWYENYVPCFETLLGSSVSFFYLFLISWCAFCYLTVVTSFMQLCVHLGQNRTCHRPGGSVGVLFHSTLLHALSFVSDIYLHIEYYTRKV